MKIINLLGNEYKGTIGKSVTASKWKGRNYLKKWFKPVNPNSQQQQNIRAFMSEAVANWQTFTAVQKRAVYWYERYRKKNISPFNSYCGAYIAYNVASGAAPGHPETTLIHFEDSVPNDLEGVKCIVRKTGQATDYLKEYSDVSGNLASTVWLLDQNYDMIATKDGYEPYILTNKTAAQICTDHVMTAV